MDNHHNHNTMDNSTYGTLHSRATTLGGTNPAQSTSSSPSTSTQDRTPDERSFLLGQPRILDDPGTGTITASSASYFGSKPGQTLALPGRTNSFSPSHHSSLNRRNTLKDVPGQTSDPKDPLNRAVSTLRSARESLGRNGSYRSVMTSTSTSLPTTSPYATSITARRNQLQRQNSFGVQPNRILLFWYYLKELTTSKDTTDEKTASTLLNVLNVGVDIIFCFLYLIEASTLKRPLGHESHMMLIDRSHSFWHLLVTIATYNLVTVCCSVLFSDAKSAALQSPRHIISTLVALPFVVSIFLEDGHQIYVPYFLQSFALISRVQQALNFYIDIGVSDLPMDLLKSRIIIFAMYIFTLVYCAISAFQVAEFEQLYASGDHNNLLKLLYFTLVSISTIGYGDLTARTQMGYATVILLIVAVLSVFPWLVSGIIDAVAQAKAGEGIFRSGGHKFMIISGSLHSAQKLTNVLEGFWFTNKEYSNAAFKIVILGLSEPSKEIQALLQSARYKNRVTYLKGTPLESKDLDRIQAKYAEGIFIIADRNSPFSPQEEDRHNTLSTLAFRNASDAGIYTYNLLPESEIYQKMAATQVVCADELRQVLLAFNCLQQATATLVLNLLHQHRPSTEKFSEVWEAEYDDSLGNEFYISYLNPIFDGKPFGFVSWFLYRRFQVILFGVRIRLQSGEYHTALNPGRDYLFQHNEQCIFIAQNPSDLDDINELSAKNLDTFLKHLQETQDQDYVGVGPDYHANNLSKALLAMSSQNRCSTTPKVPRSAKSGSNGYSTGMPYSRKSGRYQVHSAMPTITNEEDEIDVEPEVSFMSGPEDNPSESVPNAPPKASPKPPLPSPKKRHSEWREAFRRDHGHPAKKGTLLSEGPSPLRVDYPAAPFAGAKVPLCILVDTRNGGERTLSDFVISSWADVLAKRQEKASNVEFDRPGASTSPETAMPTVVNSTAELVAEPEDNGSAQQACAEPGHILVCSPNYDIFRLVCTLRSAHLKQIQDVVVLCPRQPTAQEFKLLKTFPQLYFIIGDCLLRDDLERGAITQSSKYLFLRHPDNAGVDGSFFDSVAVINRILVQQIFSDTQISRLGRMGRDYAPSHPTSADTLAHGGQNLGSIQKPVSLQSLCEGPQCVYELVEERSIEFLQIRKTEVTIGQPKFATLDGAGGPLEPFGPETDSGYYGYPREAPVNTRRKNADPGTPDFYHNPIYASGGVLVGGLLDHVLYQLYSNPSILQLIKLLCGIRTKADVKRDRHLFRQFGPGCYLECVPMPEGFGVETIRRSDKGNGSTASTPQTQSSTDSDSETSDDEDDAHPKSAAQTKASRKKGKKNPRSFSRAASKGKRAISNMIEQGFHRHHPMHGSDSSSSIDSDYMFDNRHKNFLHLYEHFALDQGVIPIGLLRLQGDDPKTVHLGIGGSSRCYAITNPLLDTVLLDTDMVFVLTR